MAFVVGLAVLVGCGKKGPPAPPLRFVPSPSHDLAVRQRGGEAILDFAYPRTAVSGLALPGLAAVEVLELARPLGPEGAPPPLDPGEPAATARLRATLQGAALGAAVAGDRIALRLPLEDLPPVPEDALFFAVRTVSTSGERSDLSNLAVLIPVQPPPPPPSLDVEPRQEGIEVAWEAPAVELAGFRLYRREAIARDWGEPIHTAPAEARRHLDTTAAFGDRYVYTVTAVGAGEPGVESALAGEREVAYEDSFSPPPPRRPAALTQVDRIRLLWDESPAPDAVGYVVERRGPTEAAFQRLTPVPIPGLEHTDRDVVPGALYSYRVRAVDRAGNLGEPSPEVEAEAPHR